jgi:hypothetical protein
MGWQLFISAGSMSRLLNSNFHQPTKSHCFRQVIVQFSFKCADQVQQKIQKIYFGRKIVKNLQKNERKYDRKCWKTEGF